MNKKVVEIVIMGDFTSLNEYINAERASRYLAADIKRVNTEQVMKQVGNVVPLVEVLKPPYKVSFVWYCVNQKKDIDNISFAKKFIFDGLVEMGVLSSDGWKVIGEFGGEKFVVDKQNPRVLVRFSEMER